MNSMSGRWPSSLCSSLPRIHVIFVVGHVSCSVRTTGSTWHTSPNAERRRMQIDSGGVLNRGCFICGSKW